MLEVLPNGTLVEKCKSTPGDTHRDGAPAVILARVGPVQGMLGYFVEWKDRPNVPVFVAHDRLRRRRRQRAAA
jgi:hypothetical protein